MNRRLLPAFSARASWPRINGFVWAAGLAAALQAADLQAQQPATKLEPAMSRIRDRGVVTIAHRPDAFPVGYLDANKRAAGYGIDVCREIVRLMERDLKRPLRINWVEVSARTRFEFVSTGKADMECGNTINDPNRRKNFGYAMPYLFTGPRFLVRVDSGIEGLHDLAGKRIGVVVGTNSIPLLKTRIDGGSLKGASIVEFKTYEEGLTAVEKGDIAAFATIELLLAGQRARSKQPEALRIVGAYLALEPVAILLPKDDVELKRTVDRHLAALMLDGTVASIYNKWFMQPIPPENLKMDLPMTAVMRDQLRWPSDRLGDEIR